MTLSIDVVIPTFGHWELTERCLEHLQAQTAPHTVIVADNGSTDDTTARIREQFAAVRLLELGTNTGFATACNRGVASGNGDLVVLLNNDVYVRPDFLEKLVARFDDPQVGTAAPLLLRLDEQTIDCVGVTADRTLAGFARLRGRPAGEASNPRPLVVGPLGGAGAYRRSAWEAVEGLDEGILFYGEDTDLAIRLRSEGWGAVAVPDAVAVHGGSATAGTRTSWQRFHSGFGRGYLARRYRLLSSSIGPRTVATEAVVVGADAVMNRDLSALRGRVAGWRAGRNVASRTKPPAEATDGSIGFIESLKLRRAVYAPAAEARLNGEGPGEGISRKRTE